MEAVCFILSAILMTATAANTTVQLCSFFSSSTKKSPFPALLTLSISFNTEEKIFQVEGYINWIFLNH